MALGVSTPQAWSIREVGDTASVAEGAISAGSLTPFGVFALVVPAQGAGGNVDFTGCPYTVRVLDVWCMMTAGTPGAHTTQLFRRSGGVDTSISDTMNTNVADTTIVRAGIISDDGYRVAATDTLRVTVSAASTAMIMFVEYARVA